MHIEKDSLDKVLIYGANGYTGRLTAHIAAHLGLHPVLGGRNQKALDRLKDKTGLQTSCFDLSDVNHLAKKLEGFKAVVHMAGPFSKTAEPMLKACCLSGTHYLDITGEIKVFETIASRHHELVKAGVLAIPGIGFDVVPTDCLALKLKQALPDASNLELAFVSNGSISRGTLKTMVESLSQGTWVRRNGKFTELKTPPMREIALTNGRATVAGIGWGDVSTAFRTTGIPNITVYTGMPKFMQTVLSLGGRFKVIFSSKIAIATMQAFIEKTVDGPSAQHVARAKVYLWGRVENAAGKSVEMTAESVDGYRFTAISALLAAANLSSSKIPAGSATPAQAFGANYFEEVMTLALNTPVPFAE